MEKDKHKTDVIFRKDTTKDFKGQIYALFPHQVETRDAKYKTITINGYEYQYDPYTGKLYLDGSLIDKKHMTPNELKQLDMWVNYNGVPMISYNL